MNDSLTEEASSDRRKYNLEFILWAAAWILIALGLMGLYIKQPSRKLWGSSRAQKWFDNFVEVRQHPFSAQTFARNTPQNYIFAPHGILQFSAQVLPDLYPRISGLHAVISPQHCEIHWKGKSFSAKNNRLSWISVSQQNGTILKSADVPSADALKSLIEDAAKDKSAAMLFGQASEKILVSSLFIHEAKKRFPNGPIYVPSRANVFGYFDFGSSTVPLILASPNAIDVSF